MTETKKIKKPEIEGTFISSLVVFLICVAILSYGIIGLGLDAHIPLCIATCAVVIYGGLFLHIKLEDLEKSIYKSITDSLGALVIICIIGMLIATWIACGTIPYIIYLGLEALNPSWFLGFVVVMCGILSSLTGSSWTTAGTIGVAFMGIAIGLGIPEPITAGAIICGSFFGDKQSPVSDYVIFASGVCKVNIYKHARVMLYTSGPAFLISAILFFVIGTRYSHDSIDPEAINTTINGLHEIFNFNISLWIPLIVLIITIVLKLPGFASLFISALAGGVMAIIVQGDSLGDILGNMMYGYTADTDVAEVASICNRGGLQNMTFTMTLIMCALAMGGVLDRSGVLLKIVYKMKALIASRAGLIITTFISSSILGFFSGDPYVGGYVPVRAFEYRYNELKISRTVLSRTISDAACVQQPLVPWGISGVYCSQTLGVPVGQYLPYYFMAFLTPVFVILWAVTGKCCPPATEEELESSGAMEA